MGNANPSSFMGPPDVPDPLYRRLARMLPTAGKLVDLGCGRGRWLRFATERGMDALGVDEDQWSVNQCAKAGLRAMVSDIWSFLDDDRAREVLVFSAFHVVEHFPPDDAQRFIELLGRQVLPGGLCIFVTPNFGDWGVASETFWLDPTHVRPYPLALMRQMCERAGLEMRYQQNLCHVKTGLRSQVFRPFNRLRFGGQFDRMNSVTVAAKPYSAK